MNPAGIVTLTTDFGEKDAYVGIVKGVILTIFPSAKLVDISHQVSPQAIQEASFLLRQAVKFFPTGTVHLAVVDPGVGTERRAIIVETNEHYFVGPDNGIFSDFLDGSKVYHLNRKEFFLNNISNTFHARDVFAPICAYLASGRRADELGSLINDPVRLEKPAVQRSKNRLFGQIIHIDRFGNLITNIPSNMVPQNARVRILGKEIDGISFSYTQEKKDSLIAIIGSAELLEIALPNDNASQRLKARLNDKVEVILPEDIEIEKESF